MVLELSMKNINMDEDLLEKKTYCHHNCTIAKITTQDAARVLADTKAPILQGVNQIMTHSALVTPYILKPKTVQKLRDFIKTVSFRNMKNILSCKEKDPNCLDTILLNIQHWSKPFKKSLNTSTFNNYCMLSWVTMIQLQWKSLALHNIIKFIKDTIKYNIIRSLLIISLIQNLLELPCQQPFTQCFGVDAKYAKHLRVFGEMCVVAETDNKVGRIKIDPRGKISLFVGYSTQHAGDVCKNLL